jgi:hypothetical protein
VLRILICPQTILQIGLGGYLIGRSAEKIVPGLMKKRLSVYSISIAASSRSRLIFGIAILGSIFFATLFGLAAGLKFSYADYRMLTIGYIISISLYHGCERWNRHLFERKPFLQFLYLNSSDKNCHLSVTPVQKENSV